VVVSKTKASNVAVFSMNLEKVKVTLSCPTFPSLEFENTVHVLDPNTDNVVKFSVQSLSLEFVTPPSIENQHLIPIASTVKFN